MLTLWYPSKLNRARLRRKSREQPMSALKLFCLLSIIVLVPVQEKDSWSIPNIHALPKVYVYSFADMISSSHLRTCTTGYHGVEVLAPEMIRSSRHIYTTQPDEADFMYVPFTPACFTTIYQAVDKVTHDVIFPNLKEVRKYSGSVLQQLAIHSAFPSNRHKPHIFVSAQGFGRLLVGNTGFEVPGVAGNKTFDKFNFILWGANGELNDASFKPSSGDVVVPVLVAERKLRISPGARRPILVSFSGKIYTDYHLHSRGTRQFIARGILSGRNGFKSIVFRNTSKSRWVDIHAQMTRSKFCLALEGWWSWTPRITEAVVSGCVPVLVSANQHVPFHRTIPFDKYGLQIHPRDLASLPSILQDAVESGNYARLAGGISEVQRAFDWLPPNGRALEYVLQETKLASKVNADALFSPIVVSPQKKETPIGLHYTSFSAQSSTAVLRLMKHRHLVKRVTVCIDSLRHDTGPIVRHFLEPAFKKIVHRIIIIGNPRSVHGDPNDRILTVPVADIEGEDYADIFNACAQSSETAAVLWPKPLTTMSPAELLAQLNEWSQRSDEIVGRRAFVLDGNPAKLIVSIDDAIVHVMWLRAIARMRSFADYMTLTCATIALNAVSFSITHSIPTIMHHQNHAIVLDLPLDVINDRDCIRRLTIALDDVYLPNLFPNHAGHDIHGLQVLEDHGLLSLIQFGEPSDSRKQVMHPCTCRLSGTALLPVHPWCNCTCLTADERRNFYASAQPDSKATVLLMSVNSRGARGRLLAEMINRYVGGIEYSEVVEKVVLIWNGDRVAFEGLGLTPNVKRSERLVVRFQAKNSLNNRWLTPIWEFPTEAVLVQDDDIFPTPVAISTVLRRWEESSKSRWVVTFARGYTFRVGQRPKYSFVEAIHSYSMALPRFGILHRKHFLIYQSFNNALTSYVDTQDAHCDDILMSIALLKQTGQLPLRVELPAEALFDVGKIDPGLTSQNSRRSLRSACLSHITEYFFGPNSVLPIAVGNAEVLQSESKLRSCPIANSLASLRFTESIVRAEDACERAPKSRWVRDLCDVIRQRSFTKSVGTRAG
jgi:hypothetical protein